MRYPVLGGTKRCTTGHKGSPRACEVRKEGRKIYTSVPATQGCCDAEPEASRTSNQSTRMRPKECHLAIENCHGSTSWAYHESSQCLSRMCWTPGQTKVRCHSSPTSPKNIAGRGIRSEDRQSDASQQQAGYGSLTGNVRKPARGRQQLGVE